jgi:hypothetical protein
LLIEVAVVVVLVGHAAAFVVLWRHQARYDGEARAIAGWMHERHEERLAWPRDLRTAVPALLDAGVTPVLTDDPPAPQQLAVNATPVVVTRHAGAVDDLAIDEFREGPFVARLVDLERAALVPLRTGEVVGEQIARPYVFAPVHDSRLLANGKAMRTMLLLAPGSYVLQVEAFVARSNGMLQVPVTVGFRLLARKQFALASTVERPLELAFRVPAGRAQTVTISFIAQQTNERTPAFLDRWQLERTATAG